MQDRFHNVESFASCSDKAVRRSASAYRLVFSQTSRLTFRCFVCNMNSKLTDSQAPTFHKASVN